MIIIKVKLIIPFIMSFYTFIHIIYPIYTAMKKIY